MLLAALVKHRYLTHEQQKNLLAQKYSCAAQALIHTGIFTSLKLADILSHLFREPLHSIQNYAYQDASLLKYKNLVLSHQTLPLKVDQNELLLAVSDPTCIEAQNDFRFNTQLKIKIALVDHQQLCNAIRKLYGKPLTHTQDTPIFNDVELAKLDEVANSENQETDDSALDEAPVSRYIQQVLLDAIRKQVSDIHFEPFEKTYQIRFRIDGQLQLYSTPPIGISRRISSRLKIIAKLNIAQRRLPQDGRIKFNLNNNQAIDMRVSTLPTLWGEKIVLRLLNNENTPLDLDCLGFDPTQKQHYLDALNKPQGMILITGPTGSGKTVSLYTGLNYLNTQARNIASAEDPIEINLPGVNQVNINAQIGLTFAATLRAFLRQDPDVVMVGEIRDLETAEIAIKAAQTGHMVLSTLHTNSAPEAITRLANMGIAFYNLAASLSLVIAQRLVRKLCPYCKKPNAEQNQLQMILQRYPNLKIEHVFKADLAGCEQCNQGYLGRMGIYEVMPITGAVLDAIGNAVTAKQLAAIASEYGMLSMQQAGIEKVNAGLTSLEELKRVMNF